MRRYAAEVEQLLPAQAARSERTQRFVMMPGKKLVNRLMSPRLLRHMSAVLQLPKPWVQLPGLNVKTSRFVASQRARPRLVRRI